MRYYIIAGEHSGDVHGADLIRQIKRIDYQATFWACGGLAMSKAMGRPCNVDGSKMGYIGIDFLKKWYALWKVLQFCQKSLIGYQPDLVILIDYSGFNMRIAAFAKRNGFPVDYYIPPKIWAHGSRRIEQIKRNVDRVWSILPFEVAYYQAKGYCTIHYVGHPLVQKVSDHRINPDFITENKLDNRPIIALLPGSRWDEIRRLLPLMVAQADGFKGYQLVVAGLSHLPKCAYKGVCSAQVKLVYDQTYDLMAVAKAGIVASGTASLEAALFNLPQIVVYKLHPLAYFFYKRMVTIQYISLVNLLVDELVVPELIQYQLTSYNLYLHLTTLLSDSGSIKQQAAYQVVRELLGKEHAAAAVAKSMYNDRKKMG
ncbi:MULTISPECIES: lipid-A-disaccharide synthase [unclassified Candidatus Cardinium]|uniref:lipid-A-disaccharide synthase n=1 Tax=unclassified Candidatus Cardinium TaxID=2641185 RepID=UPI001FB335E5|nr:MULTISPECIES: lipid-A-disaccharide synthase [unclassified Candidatus Cardinium]